LFGVWALGILKGLLLEICLTLIAVMKKISTPQVSVLGRLGSTGKFVDVSRHPKAQTIPGLLIYRPNGIVFFANASRVFQHLRQNIAEQDKALKAIVLNLEAAVETDVTSLYMLEQLVDDLRLSGVELFLARLSDPVESLLSRSGLLSRLGEGRVFRGVDLAVEAFLKLERGD
jgi:MFS superfamily sulfate permease-like transporter